MKKIIPTQDPKYGINEYGQICNLETGVPIPPDEPIFILRAKDILAEQTIGYYRTMISESNHIDAIEHRCADFRRFRNNNPGKMRAPDTLYPYPNKP